MSGDFDLGTFKQSQLDTAEINIAHPLTGEETGMKIRVVSLDSDKYHQISMKLQNENIKYARKNRGKTTAEKLSSDAIELLANVTVGWDNIKINGEDLPFSLENARKLYEDYAFIKEQVDEFIGDRRNFIKA